MIYFEWCAEPNQRDGTFLTEGELNSRLGFRSVYGFIEKPDSSKGLNKYEVYSDTLFMDFDDGVDGEVLNTLKVLDKEQIAYSLYTSGSKGCHIHVPITPISGIDVPYSQRQFVLDNDFKCDLSLYRHSSLFRLPNTIHKKTQKPKELIAQHKGYQLDIPYVKAPPKFQNIKPNKDNMLYVALTRCAGLVNISPQRGERTKTTWSVSRNLCEAGIHFDVALELMYVLNDTWNDPMDAESVLRAVKQGYTL